METMALSLVNGGFLPSLQIQLVLETNRPLLAPHDVTGICFVNLVYNISFVEKV